MIAVYYNDLKKRFKRSKERIEELEYENRALTIAASAKVLTLSPNDVLVVQVEKHREEVFDSLVNAFRRCGVKNPVVFAGDGIDMHHFPFEVLEEMGYTRIKE